MNQVILCSKKPIPRGATHLNDRVNIIDIVLSPSMTLPTSSTQDFAQRIGDTYNTWLIREETLVKDYNRSITRPLPIRRCVAKTGSETQSFVLIIQPFGGRL